MSLPPIVAELRANTGEFMAKMHEVRDEMKKTAKEGSDHASSFGSTLGHVAMAGAASVAAIGVAAAAFAGDSLKTFEGLAGSVAKMQRLTGGAAEDMSRLAFAAHESGISQETLEKSMTKLSKAAMTASTSVNEHTASLETNQAKVYDQMKALEAQGKLTGAQQKHLAALTQQYTSLSQQINAADAPLKKWGITLTDAHGKMRPMKDILLDAAGVFAKMPAGIEKNALAMQMFGKSGTDMLPFLNRGKKGVEELMKESDKYGLTIGQKSVDAYKKNLVAQREMHAAMEGLKVQIGEHLMPIVAKITSWFAAHLPEGIAIAKQVIADIMPVFRALGDGIAWVVNWVRDHWPQIHQVIQETMTKVKVVIDAVWQVIQVLWAKYGDRILAVARQLWTTIKAVIHGTILVIQGIIETVMAIIHGKWGKAWDGIKKVVEGVWVAIKGVVQYAIKELALVLQVAWGAIRAVAAIAWDKVKSAVMTPINGLKVAAKAVFDWFGHVWDGAENVARGVWNRIRSVVSGVVGDIKAVVSGIWDGLKSGFVGVLNWIIDKLDMLIKGANELPLVNIPTIPKITGMASGGTVRTAGLFLVGEKGPELVSLPKGGTVYPNGTGPKGQGGVTIINNNNGITDIPALVKMQARDFGWALRVAV